MERTELIILLNLGFWMKEAPSLLDLAYCEDQNANWFTGRSQKDDLGRLGYVLPERSWMIALKPCTFAEI